MNYCIICAYFEYKLSQKLTLEEAEELYKQIEYHQRLIDKEILDRFKAGTVVQYAKL